MEINPNLFGTFEKEFKVDRYVRTIIATFCFSTVLSKEAESAEYRLWEIDSEGIVISFFFCQNEFCSL